ncbi:putative entry exclusion protein TrbK-alt [Sinorhizobium sp. 7-81]|uniref:putative entry exclusion protein TrbK-alt n=1 Tax=Sinorhizobium sp. 8-89 TaxID=3049089 RepID=UPI0024C2A868|nr:putative entry exclusion protein TrbK-alt [Sinorhizobium sp. 8-89]MDK1494566.1 putative entry exclusion protein TrbK-alt [Sinorhizobium sp. 8-89]
MDPKIAARITAVLAIGAGLTATFMAFSQRQRPEETPVFRSLDPGGDPARTELLRCRDLGAEALNDKTCLGAWIKSRRRFLTRPESDRPDAPASGAGGATR